VSGFDVVTVDTGARAVEMVRGGDFDLVLMDVQMPVMDGIAATKAIRALTTAQWNVPIVGITASTVTADLALCLDAGMQACLTKPLDFKRLREVMEDVAPAGTVVNFETERARLGNAAAGQATVSVGLAG
jgi:CheY-like chemotaxis protein